MLFAATLRLTAFVLAYTRITDGAITEASVYYSDGKLRIKLDTLDKEATAYGTFKDELFETGWGELEIKAGYGKPVSDADMMYAAGALEGALTAKHISTQYQNIYNFYFPPNHQSDVPQIKNFFIQQQKWSTNMQIKHKATDPFWRHVSYVDAQLDGLYAGYKYAADNSTVKPDVFIVQLLNAAGDMIDLRNVFGYIDVPSYTSMTKEQLLQFINLKGHCSALVKVTGAYENLYMAHSSWFIYSSTNRIYKHYHFNLKESSTAAKSVSFSSYPGFLESLDDFYIMSSKLVMLQTTNNIFNASLYQYVTPESLLAWQRVRIANTMAHTGSEWFTIFKRYNSGTYNNQYMIIDLKKIQLGQSIDDDALWVVEQVPSLVVGADQTPILRTGYWPSYNVPFYEAIYNISGYPQFVEKHGTDFSYQLAPRAKIFRRDQGNVTDMVTMQHIMRYNDYLKDPYSAGEPCNTICCRGDLSKDKPSPSGCYDSKVTDFDLAQKLGAYAINGPTLGEGLPPFSWTGIFANMSHVGLPQKYMFDWHYMMPHL